MNAPRHNDHPLELARRYFDHLSQGEVDQALGLWSESGRFYSRALGRVPIGALSASMRSIFGLRMIRFHVEEALHDGGRTAAIFGRGESNDPSFEYNNAYCWRIEWDEQGKLLDLAEYCDTAYSDQQFMPRLPAHILQALQSPQIPEHHT